MFTVLANIGPRLYPESTSPASEWIIWGALMGLCAVLGGRTLKTSRSLTDTVVGIALLSAVALIVRLALFTVWKSYEQYMKQNPWDREQLELITAR